MWCEELENGKVKYGDTYQNPLTKKWKKVTVTMDSDTRINRKLASKILQEKIEEKLENLLTPQTQKELTLRGLYTIYYEYLERSVKKSTYKRNITAGNGMLKLLGEDTIVNNLTAGFVKDRLLKAKELPGTTNERIKRFKAMLRWAYENDFVSDIRWIDKLKPLRDEEKTKKLEEKFLESRELYLLLQNMGIEKWKFLTELIVISGMRCGEVIALNISDVDFTNRIITVSKTYDHVHKIVTSPKTKDSNREIYMQDQLFDLCKRIKVYMAKEQIRNGYKTKLFLSNNGDYLGYAGFNKYLKEVSIKTLGRTVTTHYLRHTHVSLMAEQDVALEVIARRLGHSDSKITKRIYFHVTKRSKEKDNKQIKGVKII